MAPRLPDDGHWVPGADPKRSDQLRNSVRLGVDLVFGHNEVEGEAQTLPSRWARTASVSVGRLTGIESSRLRF
jgi:hypothetical protein